MAKVKAIDTSAVKKIKKSWSKEEREKRVKKIKSDRRAKDRDSLVRQMKKENAAARKKKK